MAGVVILRGRPASVQCYDVGVAPLIEGDKVIKPVRAVSLVAGGTGPGIAPNVYLSSDAIGHAVGGFDPRGNPRPDRAGPRGGGDDGVGNWDDELGPAPRRTDSGVRRGGVRVRGGSIVRAGDGGSSILWGDEPILSPRAYGNEDFASGRAAWLPPFRFAAGPASMSVVTGIESSYWTDAIVNQIPSVAVFIHDDVLADNLVGPVHYTADRRAREIGRRRASVRWRNHRRHE